MTVRTDIGLGDVVRAWQALGVVTDDDRRAVARVLGFDLRMAEGELGGEDADFTGSARLDDPIPVTRATPPATAAELTRSESQDPPATPIYLTTLDPVHDNEAQLSEGIARPSREMPAPLESLFADSWARAIAATLTARKAARGAIDVPRVVDALARRELLRTVPRRVRLVSATRIIVVTDVRGTIAWFREDADQLIQRLDMVTRSQTSTLISDGVPRVTTAAVPVDGESEDASIRLSAGSRVIGITDLGLGSSRGRGDPGRTRRWLAFAAVLKASRMSLVIVTPVPLARVPSAFQRSAACIFWDESTRPGLVHRRIKGLA